MYHAGGTSYVYLIYGMYSCMNIAAMTEGIPQAVLLRSVVPADEESERRMIKLRQEGAAGRRRRKAEDGKGGKEKSLSFGKHLADGPGKLCIAMGITRADNDVDMTESDSFYVTEGIRVEPSQIRAARRIGIDYAEEAADYLWRFYIEKDYDR